MSAFWSKAVGAPPVRTMGAVRRSAGVYGSWFERQPLWLRSLLYTLRLLLVVVLFFLIPIFVGHYAGRTWKYVTFGSFWCLVMWGYVHALHSERRDRAAWSRQPTWGDSGRGGGD